MSTLYVAEYSTSAVHQGTGIPVGLTPPLAVYTVTIGAGSTSPVSPFNANTKLVRVHTDGICSIKFGTSPVVATTGDMRMAANQTEYWGVLPGQTLAVIQNI